MWPMCDNGITQFYLPPTDPYLPLLLSHKALLPFGWYSLHLLAKEKICTKQKVCTEMAKKER